jgi:hypothetical protein
MHNSLSTREHNFFQNKNILRKIVPKREILGFEHLKYAATHYTV